jgi:hypothetical protein
VNLLIAKYGLRTATIVGMICAMGLVATGKDASPSEKPASTTIGDDKLVVIDEASQSHSLSHDDFRQLTRQKVKATTHNGVAEYQGVSLVDLLKSVGVKFGDDLKGKRASTVAICDASDGYRVVLALLEIDPATTDRLALIADERDGRPLDAKQGPYRLVIPSDKREIRSIRNLRTIHIVNLKDLPIERSTGKGSANASATSK